MLLVVYGKTFRLSTKTEVPYWAYKLKKYLPRRRNFKTGGTPGTALVPDADFCRTAAFCGLTGRRGWRILAIV